MLAAGPPHQFAQGVVALEQLARDGQARAAAAEPLGGLLVIGVVWRAAPAGALRGLDERPNKESQLAAGRDLLLGVGRPPNRNSKPQECPSTTASVLETISLVQAHSVLEVLSALDEAKCRAWVAGGWGVDALASRQTRDHRDLDLAIDAARELEALVALGELGYAIETDWRPARVELAATGSRLVDLHPVRFGSDGVGRQTDPDGGCFEYPSECFVTGRIASSVVPCLSADQQLRFREGYELREVGRHDIAVLSGLKSP
jgi:lincosamide nucleotidyltransferase A/C/D/E